MPADKAGELMYNHKLYLAEFMIFSECKMYNKGQMLVH